MLGLEEVQAQFGLTTCRSKSAAYLELVDHILANNRPFDFDFAVNDIAGNPLNKTEFAGKVLIVDVWGTWSPPAAKKYRILSNF